MGNLAIKDGKIYEDVVFVDSKLKSEIEILYDRKKYDRRGNVIYLRHDRVVAVKRF
jgi:hypothetical protein